ncbi:MAG: 4'-phosphopantetheinyl transferase superfamily protein [Bacteroidales bacterium]|nr:4'-phosphopantetheinyl transferase superfamily protein [Bacteroidales bacterium]
MNIESPEWASKTDLTLLPSNELFVFYGSLSSIGSVNIEQYLTTDELSKAHRMVVSQQVMWIATHTWLRVLCAKLIDTYPLEVVFQTSESGKPYLENREFKFNISHTGSGFLIAISRQSIGVDLEEKLFSDHSDALDFAFSDEEKRFCKNGEMNQNRFYTVWTAKEAYCKALGIGLTDNLRELNVVGKHANSILKSGFSCGTFFCPNGEIASVVFPSSIAKVCYFNLDNTPLLF